LWSGDRHGGGAGLLHGATLRLAGFRLLAGSRHRVHLQPLDQSHVAKREVNHDAFIASTIPVCAKHDPRYEDGKFLRNDHTAGYWTTSNSSIASVVDQHGRPAGNNATDQVTVHTSGTGTVAITNLYLCCDFNGADMALTATLTITPHALAASVFGDTEVNTGISGCYYDVGASGGYPPYTYYWSVDGTTLSGQSASQVQVRFDSDGTHLVSVLVTDSHSQRTYGNLYVTSDTSYPPQVTCHRT
jgi:hypothetical protein